MSETEERTVWQDGEMVAGEPILIEMVETQISTSPLTIRVFRARFETSEEDLVLYDELEKKMEVERSSLVRRQWADPGAEMVEGAALHKAIAGHLDVLVTPERKADLLARP